MFKEEIMPIQYKLLQKLRRREYFPTYSEASSTLTLKSEKDITRKKNRPIFLLNIDGKILNKILANQNQQYIKWIIYQDQVGFFQGMQG